MVIALIVVMITVVCYDCGDHCDGDSDGSNGQFIFQVGYFNHIELVPSVGRKDTIITRSINPPIFGKYKYMSNIN